MKYNPQIHHRKSIRLKGYDYTQPGAYFITICCANKICRFGKIENDIMILNELGTIAFIEWTKLPEQSANIELDVFQIMPNHLHGIIVVGAPLAGVPGNDGGHPKVGHPQGVPLLIGDMVGRYKSLVFNACLDIYKTKNETMGKLWQRDFYEHIIRGEKAYQKIYNYIINNPSKWKEDKFYMK